MTTEVKGKTISRDEYLKLLGLFALITEHMKVLNDLERTAATLVGDGPDNGPGNYDYVSDAIWQSPTPDVECLIRRLGITVEDE